RNGPPLELLRRHPGLVVVTRRHRGHREAVVPRGRFPIALERLHVGGHEENTVPAHLLACREDRLEMASVKRIEGTAADRDSHRSPSSPAVGTGSSGRLVSASRSMTGRSSRGCSRTNRASLRTSSFTPS